MLSCQFIRYTQLKRIESNTRVHLSLVSASQCVSVETHLEFLQSLFLCESLGVLGPNANKVLTLVFSQDLKVCTLQ